MIKTILAKELQKGNVLIFRETKAAFSRMYEIVSDPVVQEHTTAFQWKRRNDVTPSEPFNFENTTELQMVVVNTPKQFNVQHNIGHAKYVVNHHDGYKLHNDGSPFYDIAIFSNKKKLNTFIKELIKKGYLEK